MTATTPELHMTVMALSMPGEANDLSHEARLVKASLLYADRVTLVSPKATMLAMLSAFVELEPGERREAVEQIVRANPQSSDVLRMRDELRTRPKGSRRPEELLASRRIEERLAKAEREMADVVERLTSSESATELASAIQAGLLVLHPLGVDQGTTDQMVLEATRVLAEAVAPDAEAFPLFDDSAGGMLKAMLREGRVLDARMAAATQAGLAGRYIERIETFPDAPMAVVLEAREALSTPLVRFRAGISEMAAALGTTPLDVDFGPVADDHFRREIAPQLDELRHLAHERRLISLLRREVATVQPGAVMTTGMGLAATLTLDLPDLASIVAAAGSLAPVGAGLAGGMRKRREELDDRRRKNKFLWLYEVGPQLAEAGPR